MEAVASTAYKKIAMLVDFVESHVSAGDATSLLRAIELFGAGIGQWLKVAADCKAQLVEASMLRRTSWISDACVELGTFVGYTAIRLARWVAGWGPKAASAGVPGRSALRRALFHGPPRHEVSQRPLPVAACRCRSARRDACLRQHAETGGASLPMAHGIRSWEALGGELVHERVRALELRGLDARERLVKTMSNLRSAVSVARVG